MVELILNLLLRDRLAFVFYVKVKSISDKSESLGFSMIGSSIAGKFLIFFILIEINDLIIYLVLDGIVLFDEFTMTLNDFFTEIVVHFAELDF